MRAQPVGEEDEEDSEEGEEDRNNAGLSNASTVDIYLIHPPLKIHPPLSVPKP